MFEVWVITGGNGRGELILAEAGRRADFPARLRRRIRMVGPSAFATEKEAAQFRRERQPRYFTPSHRRVAGQVGAHGGTRAPDR